jgi:zinc transporter ZupT
MEDENEDDFDWRGGMTQAVGIILGFSLNFLGRWSLAEGKWEWIHMPALLALVGGCGVLIYSMYRLTMPQFQHHTDPSHDVILCTSGIVVTLLGFVLAIVAAWIRGY